jgi:hypothetical protein
MSDLVEATINPDLRQLEENKVVRRARITRPRWDPKVWHPVYEEIVLLDALGYKNTEIAAEKGLTVVHISNILCSPKGKLVKRLILAQTEKRREETVDQWFDGIVPKAMKRIKDVVEDDDLAMKKPLEVFDRALTFLKAAGKTREREVVPVNSQIVIPHEAMRELVSAITRSDKARERVVMEDEDRVVTEKIA